MVSVQHLIGPAALTTASTSQHELSLLSYNVLLPNSVDGWWNYKMYDPTGAAPHADVELWSTWEYRKELLKDRIAQVNADVVCIQEVSPVSFEDDFRFMQDLGYDAHEMFKKGRFRPATFWKTSRLELASPPVHKDRTLLTAFRPSAQQTTSDDGSSRVWYVLNCHLQAGQERRRRLRQINEGVRAVLTLARKLKERNPERHIAMLVCGDFNGGSECGAVRYLEDGFVDENFREDGEPVTSGRKDLPLESPMMDVASCLERPAPPTLVVKELISTLVHGEAYENPRLSEAMLDRLGRIYSRLATQQTESGTCVMGVQDVESWLTTINKQLGRGSEFREAAKLMGWKENDKDDRIQIPPGSALSLDGFIKVYESELQAGKFWGIAYDMAVLGEPLPDAGVFESRYDRIYCSDAVQPTVVMDFSCTTPCPNEKEPSDHLPVAAQFAYKGSKGR